MAKNGTKPAGNAESIESIEATPESLAEPAPIDDRPVWRTVALARRHATVAFSLGCISYQGGEIEEDPSRVEVLRTVEGFEMIDLRGTEQLEELRADLAAEVASLVARAERIGYALVRQGARK